MSIAFPVLVLGMCQRFSSRTLAFKALFSSEIRTPVAKRIRTESRFSRFMSAFMSTAISSSVSINLVRFSGRLPMIASSWMPAHGDATISFLPAACLKMPRKARKG